TGLIISFFQFSHDFEEDTGLGLLFKLRGVRRPPTDVVVVSVDKESSEHLNVPDNPDKWPRSLHARLVDHLSKAGAAVVTFDIHFLEPRSANDDTSFADAIRKAGNVVLADALTAKEIPSSDTGSSYAVEQSIVKIMKPFAPFAQSAIATAPFVLPRIPFKVNQYWTFQTGAFDSPTFPVVAFQLYAMPVYGDFVRLLQRVAPAQAAKLPQDAEGALKTKDVSKLIVDIRETFESEPSIETKAMEQLERSEAQSSDGKRNRLLKALVKLYGDSSRRYVNYYGPPRTITTIPYYRALQLGESADSGKTPDVKGKAVFVGLSEKLLAERKDSFYTVFSQANGVFISGVEIAATAFSNILEDTPVKPISSRQYILVILFWGLLIGIFCRISSITVGASGALALSVLYLFGAEYRFKTDGTWYPIFIPLFVQSPVGFFAAVLWNYVETNKERKHIRKALAYYVPDEVVDQLAKNIIDIKNSGQMVYGACLFADVAGYTSLSEKMNPQQLSDLMHKYFQATFEPVKKHGGLVVNLKGDSFLAIWKAARAEEGLRQQACLAALDVAKAVHRFNGSYENLNLPTRVGVHSGQIFLGNIGAGDHYEYGPTGDTVNTASRMDGLNKYLGTEVLASEEIIHHIDGVLSREVGKFILKGKAEPIVVHELMAHMEEVEEKQKKACEVFAEALGVFRKGAWDEAEQKFRHVIENSEGDGPAQFYLRLCAEYKTNPPEEPWEGVVVLEEK
ncbi:MAG TPA: adenylate/guanylate cyclase domain-containing protein, partial [Methylomirabilota bacterium]|nr:adenylate/guanylate cyclase domain-containing protein [Methylomirabilota bacterium]